MKYLPGHLDDYARYLNWTQGEKIGYMSVSYLNLATYGFLVVLAVRNMWAILYKQKEYKNLPVLAFYAFALLSLSLRLAILLGMWTVIK